MFRSMTAFGRERREADGKDITVEIRSVNNRYLDCQVKLPHAYAPLEQRIKQHISQRGISRGKVDVGIFVEFPEASDAEIIVNREYAERYIAALRSLKSEFGLDGEIGVMDVAREKEIFSVKKPETDMESEWNTLLPVLDAAIDKFIDARCAEGSRIQADLSEKIDDIGCLVEKISELSKQDIGGYKTRLEERLRAALADNKITVDEGRILTECAIYADRASIDEELVRLKSHFCAFYEYAEKNEPVGRSLDFLIQEMNREINTVGSKCGSSDIAHTVVEVKTEIEKVREQIQNVE